MVHQSPHLKHDFVAQNRLALTISVTHSFLCKLHDATKETGLSYVDILNTQLTSFQIQTSDRLEKFASISSKVKSTLKGHTTIILAIKHQLLYLNMNSLMLEICHAHLIVSMKKM